MVTYASLGQLEDVHHQESRAARRRIELAEECVGHYRSRIHLVQESFYELSARHGIQDDPDFRAELERVTDMADEYTRHAGWRIARLEEDYRTMMSQQSQEQERFIEGRRLNG
jgi:hypothetical protein